MAPDQFRPSPVRSEISERDRFLGELRACGNVGKAAARTGIAKSTLYRARRKFRDFGTAWDQIIGNGTDKLEAAMLDRAINGVVRTRKLANGSLETWRVFSEPLAIFMLKKRMAHIYGDDASLVTEAAPVKILSREDMLARIAAIRGD